jgi:hypothetical protein
MERAVRRVERKPHEPRRGLLVDPVQRIVDVGGRRVAGRRRLHAIYNALPGEVVVEVVERAREMGIPVLVGTGDATAQMPFANGGVDVRIAGIGIQHFRNDGLGKWQWRECKTHAVAKAIATGICRRPHWRTRGIGPCVAEQDPCRREPFDGRRRRQIGLAGFTRDAIEVGTAFVPVALQANAKPSPYRLNMSTPTSSAITTRMFG